MPMNQQDSEFFRPLWRRLTVTAVVALWFGYEAIFSHDPLWIAITSIALVYCAWNFFLRFPKEPPALPPAGEPPGDGPKA